MRKISFAVLAVVLCGHAHAFDQFDKCRDYQDYGEKIAKLHERGTPIEPVYATVANDASSDLDDKFERLDMIRWVYSQEADWGRVRKRIWEKCMSYEYPWLDSK
ncbi:hypothetical protein FHW84_003777 [Dyella sp. SG562]|jgi:hypothetical protein|uniref:hypothetical protein n=1 Tax=Dyella sp. SG562 TaxID=2587017 RepID=UPI00142415A1|nr:hypothetical protein [Dyella sp. SG562]NII75179.1 hypothetical protein [Dyella sp. SG562]